MQKVFIAFALSFVVAACSSAEDPGSGGAASDEADQGGASSELRSDETTRTTLNFEGTCDFLRQCSTFSRNPPPNMVQWGCEGWQVCSNEDFFVAAPKVVNVNGRSVRPCGMRVEICRPGGGGACVTGTVRDISDRAVWEASAGVFSALDLDHGLTSRCSGYGRAPVTLRLVDGT